MKLSFIPLKLKTIANVGKQKPTLILIKSSLKLTLSKCFHFFIENIFLVFCGFVLQIYSRH